MFFTPFILKDFLATSLPQAEQVLAEPGTMPLASPADHVHPRLTSTTVVILDSNGEATVNFTRTFKNTPGVVPCFIEAANNQPVVFKVKSFSQDVDNNYISCIIKAYRATPVPQNLATLLLSATFNLFTGSVTGLAVSVVAIARSDVPS